MTLPAGQAAAVLRPLTKFPLRKDTEMLPREAQPHELLLVDLEGAEGLGVAGRRVFCSARLEGAGVDGALPPTPGIASGRRTRAVQAGTAESGAAAWDERLVVPLPSRPAPQHRLVFEIWDADAAGGGGRELGSGAVDVPVASLGERDPHAVEVAITSSGGAAQVCTLKASYMLQRPWRPRLPAAADQTDEWGSLESTKGQRALSLASAAGAWSVIPNFGQQRAAGTAFSQSGGQAALLSSLVPLTVGGEGVVLEGALFGGEWRELLRGLCQVVNSTDLVLEACILSADGAHRTPLGTAAPGTPLPLPLTWQRPGEEFFVLNF